MYMNIVFAVFAIFCVENSLVSAQCCFFNPSTACVSTVGPWKPSYYYPLVTIPYPGFSSAPDPYYLYLQDGSGVVQLPTISIPDQYTFISFDYYYNNPSPNTASYLNIYFKPTSYPSKILIDNINLPVDKWLHKDIPCNNENNYCCGLLSNFPCTGELEISALLDNLPSTPVGLFGIDNIGTSCIAPPFPCCDFNTNNVCGFTNSLSNDINWVWVTSSVFVPPSPTASAFVYFEGVDYIHPGALEGSYISNEITIPASYQFTGNFFVSTPFGDSGLSGLHVNFIDSDTKVKSQLEYITTTNGVWSKIVIYCTAPDHDCCQGKGSCAGRIELLGRVGENENEVYIGVDDFGENGYCL